MYEGLTAVRKSCTRYADSKLYSRAIQIVLAGRSSKTWRVASTARLVSWRTYANLSPSLTPELKDVCTRVQQMFTWKGLAVNPVAPDYM